MGVVWLTMGDGGKVLDWLLVVSGGLVWCGSV